MDNRNASCNYIAQNVCRYYLLLSIIILFFLSFYEYEILYKPIFFIFINFFVISFLLIINSSYKYIYLICLIYFFYLITLNLNIKNSFSSSFDKKNIVKIEGDVIKDQSKSEKGIYYVKVDCKKGYLIDGSNVSLKGEIPLLIKDNYNLLFNTPIIASVEYVEEIDLYKAKEIVVLSNDYKSCYLYKKMIFMMRDNRTYLLNKIKIYLKSPLSRMLILGRCDQDGFIFKRYALSLGCAHLLALSGMHLSIISMFFITLLSKIVSKAKAKKISLFFLSYFLYITGPIPSLIRSFLMYFFSLFKFSNKLKKELILLFSAIVQALFFSYTFKSAGCLFSYSALAAIFIYSSLFDIKNKFINILLTTVFAILFTYPLSISFGGAWCVYSIILSPLLTLFITFEMVLSLIVVINSLLIDLNFYYILRGVNSIIESILKLVNNLIKELNYYLQRILHYNEKIIKEIFFYFEKLNNKLPKIVISYKGYIIFAIIVLTMSVWYLYSRESFKIRSNTIDELGFPI